MIFLYVALVIAAALLGGLTSRMCGGGKPQIGHGLEQFVYGLPYLAFGEGFLKVLSYGAAVFGKRLGHGQYHGVFGKRTKPEDDEKFDFIVKLFFGEDATSPDRWKRNVFGLFLSGIFPVLVACVLTAFQGHYAAAAIIFAGGALKPVAYLLTAKTKYFTAGGEYLTGFFAWGAASIAAIMIYQDQILAVFHGG